MERDNIIIRLEPPADYAAVERLTREVFWNVYRPRGSCFEQRLPQILSHYC